MPDARPATTPGISARMSRQARRDTAPEVSLRRELHRLGLRFRVDWPIPGMPRRRADVAFTRRQVAIFVDGCFWHACPVHKTSPVNNSGWWAEKLATNVRRDRETDAHLYEMGWDVVRVWEHDAVGDAVGRVVAALGRRDHDLRVGSLSGRGHAV